MRELSENLKYALETVDDPERKNSIIEYYQNCSDEEWEVVQAFLSLDTTQSFLYDRRMKQLGM